MQAIVNLVVPGNKGRDRGGSFVRSLVMMTDVGGVRSERSRTVEVEEWMNSEVSFIPLSFGAKLEF